MRHTLVLLSFLLVSLLLTGQQSVWGQPIRRPALPPASMPPGPARAHIGVLSRAYGDSIIVRWATDNSVLWKMATRAGGYQLTRISIGANQKAKLDFRIQVKPWTIDEWKQRVSPRDTTAGVCVELLYGKTDPLKESSGITLDKAVQQKSQNDLRLMLASVLADENPRHAQGMALGYVDKNVTKGTRYLYVVTALSNQKAFPADTGRSVVLNQNITPRPTMILVQGEQGDRTVKLVWERTLAEEAFTAYYIEKSADGGRTFRRVNKRPWLQAADGPTKNTITFLDSVAQNYHPYQYRVVGLTPFGEVSLPSPVLTLHGIDRTPPTAVTDLKATHLGKSRVRLTWQQPKPSSDLSGYLVAKSTQVKGPFLPLTNQLLPAGQRQFTDTTAIPTIPAYYVIIAVDTAKNGGPSLPAYCFFQDKDGPAKPKGLQGYIDTTGFVRIVWPASREPDLLGYRVLFANDPTHVFTTVTPDYLLVSVFNDTTSLNTLTKHLYYRVIAYDKNYNPSEPSDILTLTRPDKVRPGAPVIKTYVAGDTAISLAWEPSSSDDVREQILHRRGADTERWVELARLPKSQAMYVDAKVKSGMHYSYALMAVDSAGLRSDLSHPLNINTLRATPRPVVNLTVGLSTDQKTAVLAWKYPYPDCRFIIYRSVNKTQLRSYDSIHQMMSYTDKTVGKGQYEYAVRVIYPDGSQSALSNRANIDIR